MNDDNETLGQWDATAQIEWAIAAAVCLSLTTPHLIVMGVKLTQHHAANIGWVTALHLGVALIGVFSFVGAINQMLINQEQVEQEFNSANSPFKSRNFLACVSILLLAVPLLNV